MKNTDLLDVIGEVDAVFYEDMAENLSGRKHHIKRFVSRFGAAAAVIAAVSVTAVMFTSIFRDGIVQSQQPASSGTTQTASGEETAASQQSESEKPVETLRTDLFEIVETTTVTTTTEPPVTTTELIIPFPADMEMPDNNLRQEVGSRFLVNSMGKSGILAMTLNDVQLYDSLADAGLTFDDLTESYRETHAKAKDFFDGKTQSVSVDTENAAVMYMFDRESGEEDPENWCFVKGTLTVENINAVSGLSGMRGLTNPDGSPAEFDDFDFHVTYYGFGVLPSTEPAESNGKSYFGLTAFQSGLAYNQSEGMFYQDICRRSYIHLEPGEAITYEVGAFLPKVYTGSFREHYPFLQYEDGTELKSHYMFGGSLSRPFVELHFE